MAAAAVVRDRGRYATMTTGQAIESHDLRQASANGFYFVGGSLAIDLVNTEVIVRGKPRDLLDSPSALAAWWSEACSVHPDRAPADQDAADISIDVPVLTATKQLRAAIRRLLEATANGGEVDARDVDALNLVLAAGIPTLVTAGPREFHVAWRTRGSGPERVLLPVAQSALALLTEQELGRLHRCANERCTLVFYDTTKSATRRWCSVECMNRARSADRYRASKRAARSA